MHKLPLSFTLLTYTGYWRPIKWPVYSIQYWLYNTYSALMIFFLYFFTFCSFVDSILSEDLKTVADKFSLFISVLGVCIKVGNLFFQRNKIINLVNTLVQGNCIPRDEQEVIIQQKFDDHARNLTICCEIVNEMAVTFATLLRFNEFIDKRLLPVHDWVPYSLTSQNVYMMSLIQQTLTFIICANSSVANETLISGLMIQTSAQFEIFCHRARKLPALFMEAEKASTSTKDLKNRRKKILRNLIAYHLEIYEFAKIVNTIFQYMIFLQFCISTTVLCLSILKMSSALSFDVNFVSSLFYLCSMLMQVYLYCWFGNEVTLKSKNVSDAIYEMDWTTLPVSVMKDLLTIMMRSKRPVIMSSGYVVTLSTDSFVAIMKMSYSSYNLLKGPSNT